MGAESIKELLEAIDLEKESEELKTGLKESTGQKRAESLSAWRLLRLSVSPETVRNG